MRQRESAGALRLIVVTNVLGLAVAVTTNVATGVLPEPWTPHLWLAWPLLGLLALASVVFAIRSFRADAGTGGNLTAERAEYLRDALCRRVRRIWIDDVLQRNLYRQAFIELGIVPVFDPGGYPWDLLIDQPNREHTGRLHTGADVAALLDEHHHLVVLGLPGAGKTTLLLDLARRLLDAAAADRTKPIPVVFRLASWAQRRESLADWMAGELAGDWYGLPPDVAAAWLAEDRIVPLLDGFDEVAPAHQAACARAIGEFRAGHRLLPVVMSSRAAEYDRIGGKARMPIAIHVQPLTRSQLTEYLQRLGEPLDGMRAALRDDPQLWELLRNPFLLSMAILTYQGRPAGEVAPGASADERRQRLFDAFVTRALRRKAHTGATVSPDAAIRWLSYLARALGRRFEQVFYVSFVNVSWLPTRQMRWAATIVPMIPVPTCIGMFIGAAIDPIAGVEFGFGIFLARCAVDLFRNEVSPRRTTAAVPHALRQTILWLTLLLFSGTCLEIFGSAFAVAVVAVLPITTLLDDPSGRARPANQLVGWTPSGINLLGSLLVATLWSFITETDVTTIGLLLVAAVCYASFGRAAVRYGTVRLLLAGAGLVPLRLTSFLRQVERAMIVNHVGRGYLFHHRLLLEYFAGLKLSGVPDRYSQGLVPSIDLRPHTLLRFAARTTSLPDAAGAMAIAVPQLTAAEYAPVSLAVADAMAPRYGVWTGEFPADMTRMILDLYLPVVGCEHSEYSRAATLHAAQLILRNRRRGLIMSLPEQAVLKAILDSALPKVRQSLDQLVRASAAAQAAEPLSLLRELDASEATLQGS